MSYEASKAMGRRGPEFRKYFKGSGIDVGCGPDCVIAWKKKFPIRHVRAWDLADGDGQYLATVSDSSQNWVHSSHSLEHMHSWSTALSNWIRVVIRGGYVICTVPSWEMYEHRVWPSRFNSDHKWAFSLVESGGHIIKLDSATLSQFGTVCVLNEITTGYDPSSDADQTLGPAECCIEFVIRKI